MTILCPCGSSEIFSLCCENFINETQFPSTAEQLMRSRYSAYATNNPSYIAKTYASNKQTENSLKDIADWTEQTTWLSLQVLSTDNSDDKCHFVEFVATYLTHSELWQMQENSRFIQENDMWRYLDVDVKHH